MWEQDGNLSRSLNLREKRTRDTQKTFRFSQLPEFTKVVVPSFLVPPESSQLWPFELLPELNTKVALLLSVVQENSEIFLVELSFVALPEIKYLQPLPR